MRQLSSLAATTFVAVLVLVSGTKLCEQVAYAQFSGSYTVHPTEENLNPERIDHRVTVRDLAVDHPRFSEVADQLLNAEAVRTIGVRNGELEYIFGRVGGVVTDEANRIYVADSEFSEIKVYSYDGTFEFRIGREGEGPGEFGSPNQISRVGDDRLLVADWSTARISRFDLDDGEATFVSSFFYALPPISFCSFGNDIFIRGFSPHVEYEGGIQVFSREGEALTALGEVYDSDNRDQRVILTRGPIACHLDRSIIVAGFSRLPIIHGYTEDGSLLWVSRLEEFVPPQRLVYASGASTSDDSQDVSDLLTRITPVADGLVLVQAVRSTREGRIAGRQPEVRSYLLDAKTGEGAFVGNELPLIYEVRDDYFVGGTNAPYPHITIYEH